MAELEVNINYAEKYSATIDERFKLSSITDNAVNKEYNFDGVNTINIYSVETAELNDYKRNKTENRYGTPKELGNAVQRLTLTQDKGFAFTIDAGNYNDTVMASSAANALKRQIDEVITPTVDKYRISKMVKGAGAVLTPTTPSAYERFLDASVVLTENLVPADGRIAFVSPSYYRDLKLDPTFTGKADKANEIAVNGAITKVDNTAFIVTPSSYFPSQDIDFILVHPCATLGPVKLAEYKIHDKPQGISGWLCEGNVIKLRKARGNNRNKIKIMKYISK
ncbi:MAG: hypothetical protein K2H01_04095, partial [Ruminococcus sp.]|nr:hypothetical protein [Ruminococcus sp.]